MIHIFVQLIYCQWRLATGNKICKRWQLCPVSEGSETVPKLERSVVSNIIKSITAHQGYKSKFYTIVVEHPGIRSDF